ncbi:Gfo/Idh/MocA family protein, partial [Steroidobacter sp.]|uniref:Gfo/Idh/MocA family protein n=1 Tax=Steroidobacter sp. TaxID=1978227 RepID=UPI0025DAF275
MRVSVAIVGLGAVADSHLAAYRDLPEIEIVAVVDPRADRVRQVSESIGAPGFSDCFEMLKKVRPRIACVLSTVASHRSLTEMLAAAGVHILCEKPIANRVEDAVAMKQVCERHGVQFMYGSSYRYLPAVIQARELIASGVIGKVRLIEERGVVGAGADKFAPMSAAHYPEGTPGGGGFGLFDHGVHLLDVFPWLLGSPIKRVLGRGNYTGRAMEPEFALLEHECGALGMLTYDESTVSSDLPWEGLFSHGHGWVHGQGFVGAVGAWTPGASFLRVHGTRGALRIFHYANRLFLSVPGEVREMPVPAGAAPEHFAR